MIIEFDYAKRKDLIKGAIYKAGNKGNLSDDPISNLFPKLGNQSGFRKKLRENKSGGKIAGEWAYIALQTTGEISEWPDSYDEKTGVLTYYGDQRVPDKEILDTKQKGNKLLKDVFNWLHSGELHKIPPFFIFKSVNNGTRDTKFIGLAIPGNYNVPKGQDLKLVTDNNINNYVAKFTILNTDESPISYRWLEDRLVNFEESDRYAPDEWIKFINGRMNDSVKQIESTEHNNTQDKAGTEIEELSNYNSWEVIDNFTYLKKTDKSFFKCGSSVIPQTMIKYFIDDCELINYKKDITISFKASQFKSTLSLDKYSRLEIFLHENLQEAIRLHYPNIEEIAIKDYPVLQFCKINTNEFILDLIDTSIVDVNKELISIIDYANEGNIEGTRKIYYTTKYERDVENRSRAIKYHGYNCQCCGMNFEKIYGERGKGFIEVHHKKPLYLNEVEIKVNPYTDLVPVCPNCHRMIHRVKNEILSIEEVKKIIEINLEKIIEIEEKIKSI